LISEIWISGEAVARVAFKCLGSRVLVHVTGGL
jgi:hypothetical protein